MPLSTAEPPVTMYSIFNTVDQQAIPQPIPPTLIQPAFPAQKMSRTASKMAPSKKAADRISSTIGRFNPPQLYLAYRQAVKHGFLQTPLAPAEELIRAHHYERYSRLRQELGQEKADKVPVEPELPAVSKAECHSKIFVLVQGGYLLQYAGRGSYDRLPEKILPLGKSSVAFASDAIPGKPWVLQVSQRSSSAETGAMDNATSVFLRLSLRGSTARKAVGSLLLVLYSAEEMEAWMSTVRAQIETLGGRPLSIDLRDQDRLAARIPSPAPSLCHTTSGSQPSRGPSRAPSRNAAYVPFHRRRLGVDRDDETVSNSASDEPRSVVADQRSPFRRSFEAPSVSPSVASEDQVQLDRLRGESRLSHSSSSTSYSPSSPIGSLAGSPAKEGFYRSQPLSAPPRPFVPLRDPPAPTVTSPVREVAHSRHASGPKTPRPLGTPNVEIPTPGRLRRADSSRTRQQQQVVDEPHPGRRMSIVPPSPVTPSPTISPSSGKASDQLWSRPEWSSPTLSCSGSSSSFSRRSYEVHDPSDPTAAISQSILRLLASSLGEDETLLITSSPRPCRSTSTKRRSRRPSNRSVGSTGGPRSTPMSPRTVHPFYGYHNRNVSDGPSPIPPSCYPEPLRINKRASLFVAASGPPPLPAPVCPLPAIPLDQSPPSPTSMDSRLSELRKQSWKVTRAYHPLRIDVL